VSVKKSVYVYICQHFMALGTSAVLKLAGIEKSKVGYFGERRATLYCLFVCFVLFCFVVVVVVVCVCVRIYVCVCVRVCVRACV
jgi:hypothetical protein